jgi:hypothetical protein
MSLVNYNLDVIQGSTFSAQLFAKNADGTAIDLSGYEVRGVVKYNYGTGVALVNLNPAVNTGQAPPLNTYTAASGVVDVSIPATGAAALPVTIGVYDIEMYSAGETEVRKLLDGRVRIHPEVTNL